MLSQLKSHDTAPTSDPRRRPGESEVRQALADVLEDRHFRTSKQCRDLLAYVVDHSLRDDATALKERVVGSQVFHRNPDYDTGEDPVVRVRAADVRKRLAQYYQDHPPERVPVQIDLLPGSYRATFQSRTQPPPPSIEKNEPATLPVSLPALTPAIDTRRRFQLRYVSMAALLILFVTGAAWWLQQKVFSAERRFWAPVAQTGQSTLIYLGSNVAYRFTDAFMQHYRATHNVQQNGPEFFVDLPPDSTVRASDLAPARSTFVTTGDLNAAVQTATLLSGMKHEFTLRAGDDVSFGDLRNHPLVLIGGFNNPWTLEVTGELPFSFHGGTRIEDKAQHQMWETPPAVNGSTTDYALITRVLHAKTGGPVITIAGIGEFGTQASAEFLANPDRLRELLKSAPRDWEDKNMQAVLRIRVVEFSPVGVDVVATRYW